MAKKFRSGSGIPGIGYPDPPLDSSIKRKKWNFMSYKLHFFQKKCSHFFLLYIVHTIKYYRINHLFAKDTCQLLCHLNMFRLLKYFFLCKYKNRHCQYIMVKFSLEKITIVLLSSIFTYVLLSISG